MAIAFVAQANALTTTATLTIGVPAGTAASDAMVCFIRKRNQAVVTPPGGWAEIGGSPQTAGIGPASFYSIHCYTRIATGSEPASYSWTVPGVVVWQGVIASYSGTATTPVDVSSGNAGYQAAAPPLTVTALSVTTTRANDMLVGMWSSYNNPLNTTSWALPAGFTTRYAGALNTLDAIRVADQTLGAAGATGNQVATCVFINGTWGAFLVALQLPYEYAGPRIQTI